MLGMLGMKTFLVVTYHCHMALCFSFGENATNKGAPIEDAVCRA